MTKSAWRPEWSGSVKIEHGAWVLVGDGAKALFFRNEGDVAHPNLQAVHVMENDNPPTRDQASDAPGRIYDSKGPHRSAVENTDWHKVAEERFAKETAAYLHEAAQKNEYAKIIVAAPPRFLGDLRKAYHKDVADRVVAEIDKDFTNQPSYEIEKHISAI